MKINKVVVVGSGTMGSGIAAQLCNANIPVTLLDLTTEISEKARDRILKSRPPLLIDKSKIKFVSEDFDVSIRSKLTGFECMMSQDKVYRDKLKSFNFGDSINYQTEYSEYVNKLSGGLYG